MRESRRFGSVLFIITCLLVFPTYTTALQSTTASSDIELIPKIDRVIYRYTDDADTEFDLLLSNEIDTVLKLYYPDDALALDQETNIDLYQTTGNGYWCVDFSGYMFPGLENTYPLNISGFRRAFAYAFDKTSVTTEFESGLYSVHDSMVPSTSSFCIENELDWHYYTNQADIGNQILDDLGFAINSTTGWRDNPNGDPFRIDIGPLKTTTYLPNTMHYPQIVHSIGQAAEDALNDLHVDASYVENLWWHSPWDMDMVIHDPYFYSNNIDWLGYHNSLLSFNNATLDLYLNNLQNGTSYDTVFEAGAEVQRILHYNVPRLVVCSGALMQPYRTERFAWTIEDITRGVSGIWSLCNIRYNTGDSGGTVRIGFSNMMDNFNIYTASVYSKPFFENIWPTLFTIGPDLELVPNLATHMTSETNTDNSAIPEGHTRITVDILPNATWCDGVPLTAEDVAFTVTYEHESGVYGNPAAQDLQNLVAAYAPTSTRVIFEYNTESYWHQFDRATRYIIPKHIFNDIDGIGYEGWETWNPMFGPDDPLVTCGPFVVEDYSVIIDGEYQELIELEMIKNPNYYYAARNIPENETEPESIPTPWTPYQMSRFALGLYSSIIICVIVFMVVDRQRERGLV